MVPVTGSSLLPGYCSNYVGPEEHRRRVEAKEGKFKKYGKPTDMAIERALPGQVGSPLLPRLISIRNAVAAVLLVLTHRM